MPRRALVDARSGRFVLMPVRAGGQHEAAVAVGALDGVLLAHLQIDARMAQRPAHAVAADAARAHRDHLGGIDERNLAGFAPHGQPPTGWARPDANLATA